MSPPLRNNACFTRLTSPIHMNASGYSASEADGGYRLADDRRYLMLPPGQTGPLCCVPECLLRADPAWNGLSGVERQGPRYLSYGTARHESDPWWAGRCRLSEYGLGTQLLPPNGAGLHGTTGVCEALGPGEGRVCVRCSRLGGRNGRSACEAARKHRLAAEAETTAPPA